MLLLPCEYREADGEVSNLSLQESLGAYFRDQPPLPDGTVRRERLSIAPPNLILQLKRFWFDREEMAAKKRHTPIEISETLDVGPHPT